MIGEEEAHYCAHCAEHEHALKVRICIVHDTDDHPMIKVLTDHWDGVDDGGDGVWVIDVEESAIVLEGHGQYRVRRHDVDDNIADLGMSASSSPFLMFVRMAHDGKVVLMMMHVDSPTLCFGWIRVDRLTVRC